jgi:hypothetical protein
VDRRFVLARDPRKILRSGLPDLDPEGTAADLVENRHGVARLREKWSDGDDGAEGTDPVHVRFRCDCDCDCDCEGSVRECCMEFAALDRVRYDPADAGYVGARLLEDTFVARFHGPASVGPRREPFSGPAPHRSSADPDRPSSPPSGFLHARRSVNRFADRVRPRR